jgi:AhpC/TSA family
MMATIIHEERETEIAGARVAGDSLWLSKVDVFRATGWTLKPEGLCREDTCIPVGRGREAEFVEGDALNVTAFWRHLGHPVVSDSTGQVWVLGMSARERARALESLQAPDFTLPDLDGRKHALADHRGQKVLLVTWASW